MAEYSYEYECSRAELLGIEKPSYEEYEKKITEKNGVNKDDLDIENLAETECQNENLSGVGGKLDELHQILRGTQKKLNRFRSSYGSLTNILKIKLRRKSDSTSDQSEINSVADDEIAAQSENIDKSEEEVKSSMIGCDNVGQTNNTNPNVENSSGTPIRKSDLSKALDYQVNKLDRLSDTAEQAEISMREQSSQMKKFLNFSFFNTGGGK